MVGLLAGAAKGLLKKPKKVNPKKFAGKMEEAKASSKAKGGALAIRPVESIVKVVDIKPKDAKVKAKGGPLAEIQEGVHSIVLALRDEQKAKKKRLVLKRKNQEKKKRLNLEALSELGKTAGNVAGGLASATGITSLWGAIWKTLGLLFTGWLMNFLPQILGFVSKFIDITKKVIKVAAPIFKAIWSTFTWITDKGFKLLAMVSGIKPEEALDNSIIKNFTEIQKRIPLLEAAFAWFAILKVKKSFGGGGGPRRGIGNTLKRTKKLIQRRFFDPKRAEKLARLKNIKKLKLEKLAKLKRIKDIAKLRKVAHLKNAIKTAPQTVKNIAQSPAAQNVVKTTQDLIKNPGQTVKNIKQAGVDQVDDVVKNVGKSKWFGKLKGAGKNLWTKAGQAKDFLGNQGKSFLNWADDFGKNFMANIDEIVQGISAKASKWATQIGDIAEMAKNPAKLVEKVKGVLSGQLDDILKQNKTIAQLRNLDPKKAAGAIKGILNNAKKSKGLMQVRNALKGAQKMKIGGVDKIIAAVMGLLDYTLLGESPINAILRALGGLLGYSAGFAIGAPFGGAPGFITGMAGGFVGEKVAMLIAKKLAKTGLGEIQDPIMNDGRMLVRDPDDQGMNEQLEQDQKAIDEERGDSDKIDKTFKVGKKEYDLSKSMGGLSREDYDALSNKDRNRLNRRTRIYQAQNYEETHDNIKGNAAEEKSKDATLISSSASYDENSSESTIIPVPIGEMQGGSSGGGKTLVGSTSDSSVNKYETVNELKKSQVLSKLYSD